MNSKSKSFRILKNQFKISRWNSRCSNIWAIFVTSFFAMSAENKKILSKLKDTTENDLILFLISPVDINSPSDFGRYPDKVYSLHKLAINLGFRSQIVFHPLVANRKLSNCIPVARIDRIGTIFLAFFFFLCNSKKIKEDRNLSYWWRSSGLLDKLRHHLWRDFLNYSKPRVIFGISVRQFEALACKENSIPIFEVMHGTFSKEQARSVDVDMFLTWDSHYSKNLKALGVETKVIGHPNAEFLEVHKQLPDESVRKILVTLAWGINNSKDPFGLMSRELADLSTELNSLSYNLVFRIHPVTLQKKSREIYAIQNWLEKNYPNSLFTSPDKTSLFQDLRSTLLHITHDSSSFYEAGLLGIPTIFTSRAGYEAVPKEFVDTGGIHLWESKRNLALPNLEIIIGKKFGNKLNLGAVTEMMLFHYLMD